MLRGIGSVFSFLTILPTGSANLETVARYMYLFPLAGLALGLLVGSAGFGLSLFLDPLIVGLLVVASIAVLTGIHHADGLSDFADGLMAKGTREKRLAAMKDLSTGSAGTVSIVLYLVGLVVVFSMAEGYDLFLIILLGEIMAKFSMVLLACMSRPAWQGSSVPFVNIMKDRKRMLVSGMIALIPIVMLGGAAGLLVFATGIIATMIIAAVSARSFGGITGDVLGAANELTRLASVMVFVSV